MIVGGEIKSEIKRCYVDQKVVIACPRCKKTLVSDLKEYYLSYPFVGKTVSLYFYCKDCENNNDEAGWNVDAVVKSMRISLEYDPEKIYAD